MTENEQNAPEGDETATEPEQNDTAEAPAEEEEYAPELKRPQSGGRPKFNEETCTKIVNAIRNGNYVDVAAALAGVHKDNFYEWLRRARVAEEKKKKKEKITRKEKAFMDFADQINKALAEAEVRDNLVIGRSAQLGDWHAAAWRLARRFPERWADQSKGGVAVSGKVGEGDKAIEFTLKIADTREEAKQEEEEVTSGIEKA